MPSTLVLAHSLIRRIIPPTLPLAAFESTTEEQGKRFMQAAARLAVSLVLAACLAVGCTRSNNAQSSSEASVGDSTLGPGDVFDVRVFGEEKLSGAYQVGPDGTIDFPFLGQVAVGGREPERAAVQIREGLMARDIMRDPHVSVFVTESNSRRISVLGAVTKPGTFPIVPGISVIQAVSNAGGFTPLASKDDTVVTRRIDGKLQRYRVAVSQVSRGNQDDFPLRAGDIVFVPERVF